MENDKMIIGEVSALFGVTNPTIRNWEKMGKIKVLKMRFNNFRLYDRKEVMELYAKVQEERALMAQYKELSERIKENKK